jgi:hypothetical protein
LNFTNQRRDALASIGLIGREMPLPLARFDQTPRAGLVSDGTFEQP